MTFYELQLIYDLYTLKEARIHFQNIFCNAQLEFIFYNRRPLSNKINKNKQNQKYCTK